MIPPSAPLPDLVIRPASPSDADAIGALMSGVAHAFTLGPLGVDAEDLFATILGAAIGANLASSEFAYFTGWVGDTLVGAIGLTGNDHLFHLFVARDWQRRGIARRLWQHARGVAEQAGNPGRFSVRSTAEAVPVYERFGFRAEGPVMDFNGMTLVPMALDNAR